MPSYPGFVPEAGLNLAEHRFGLVDVFFVLVGLGSVQAMIHRLRLALRMARENPEG